MILQPRIEVGPRTLVVLVGPPGAGKSTWARRHFQWSEIVSSDMFRMQLTDDANDMSVTREVFQLVDRVAHARLRHGRLTVLDSINGRPARRRKLVQLAHQLNSRAIAVSFQLPLEVCVSRDREREGRTLGTDTIARIWHDVLRDLANIDQEGFDSVFSFKSDDDADRTAVERLALDPASIEDAPA